MKVWCWEAYTLWYLTVFSMTVPIFAFAFKTVQSLHNPGRRGGLVVECRTPEREVGGSILTQVAVLYP